VDRTTRNPNILADAAGGLWAIDHGACLFLDRILAGRRPFSFEFPANHFLAGRPHRNPRDIVGQLDRLDTEALSALADAVPESWLAGILLPRREIAIGLAAYVEAFRSRIRGSA
jgi:hypothetical protein